MGAISYGLGRSQTERLAFIQDRVWTWKFWSMYSMYPPLGRTKRTPVPTWKKKQCRTVQLCKKVGPERPGPGRAGFEFWSYPFHMRASNFVLLTLYWLKGGGTIAPSSPPPPKSAIELHRFI